MPPATGYIAPSSACTSASIRIATAPMTQEMIAAGPGGRERALRAEQPPRADDRAAGRPQQPDEPDLATKPGPPGLRPSGGFDLRCAREHVHADHLFRTFDRPGARGGKVGPGPVPARHGEERRRGRADRRRDRPHAPSCGGTDRWMNRRSSDRGDRTMTHVRAGPDADGVAITLHALPRARPSFGHAPGAREGRGRRRPPAVPRGHRARGPRAARSSSSSARRRTGARRSS